MAWVRLHDGAMTHPKVVGLSDRAFRLWVWGLSYAQQHLTDGWIPVIAIPGVLLKSVKDLSLAVLWVAVPTGYVIHDYLDWNDSRETVTKKRTEAKDRMSAARVRSSEVRANIQANVKRTSHEVLRGLVSSSGSSSGKERERNQLAPMPADAVADRAGLFCERYGELYQQHRRGARYLPRPALDFTKAVELCQVWDSERLERLAEVFLKTDHDFAASGSRTIGQFAALASWCDDRLREVEAS